MSDMMILFRRPAVALRAALLAATLSLLIGAALSGLLAASDHASGGPAASYPGVPGDLSSLPLAARGPVSGVLGASDGAYRVSTAGGQLRAANRSQGLSMRFQRSGVTLGIGRGRVGIALAGVGTGDALAAVSPASPHARSNRVTYQHAGIAEWYANGPLGLEQGFTLPRAPSGSSSGPLTLSLAISGASRVSLSRSAQSVTFDSAGAPSPLRYGGLHVTDAEGRVLRSWMELGRGGVLLRVDASTARYPISIDPLLGPGPEAALVAGDAMGEARLGYSAALSADGNTALVGGPRDGESFGAAWVFVRSGGNWFQQGPKLTGAEQTGGGSGGHCGEEPGEEKDGCGFGRSVALSADGNTALVGNPRDSSFKPGGGEGEGKWVANTGAAWVFTRSAGIWTQQGPKLTASDEGGEGRFGKSVALASDGSTALIGGSSDGAGHGAAWIFTRSGAAWAQASKLTGAEEQGETHLGGSVALSGDGNTAVVGGPGDNEFLGAAWVFTHSKGSWTQQKLTGAGETGEGHFGYSVAVSTDGTTALVGARQDGKEAEGAAYTFTRSGGTWSEQGPRLAGADVGEELGYSVALSSDGQTALVGAARANGARGTALLVTRSGESWSGPSRRLAPGAFAAGRPWFGASAALSSDARTALVGGPNDHGRIGAAWVFGPGPGVEGLKPTKGPAGGGTAVTINGSNLEEATSVWFGSTPAASFTANPDGTITAVSPPGGGVVDVTVTNAFGTSPRNAKDRFEYLAAAPGPANPGDGAASTTGTTGPAGGVLGGGPTRVCSAMLLGRGLSVISNGRARVKLVWRGAGSCRGKLRLNVRIRAGKRVRIKTIGTATFVLAHGRPRTITIKLNTRGRSLLRAGRGRLRASLLIANLPAGTAPARISNVRLTLQKPRRAKLVKK